MARLLPCVLVLLLGFPTAGRADPVTITSGHVIFTDEPGSLELTAPGLLLQGDWFPSSVFGTFWYDRCSAVACAPGAVVDFGTTTYGFSADDFSETISGVVMGTAYDELFVDATLTFTGPRVHAPSDAGGVSQWRFGPFAMDGHITVYGNRSRAGGPLFAGDLRGSGTAGVIFGTHPTTANGFLVHEVRYDFATPAPVPEPSTLLLAVSGMALCGRRVWRRVAPRVPRRTP